MRERWLEIDKGRPWYTGKAESGRCMFCELEGDRTTRTRVKEEIDPTRERERERGRR